MDWATLADPREFSRLLLSPVEGAFAGDAFLDRMAEAEVAAINSCWFQIGTRGLPERSNYGMKVLDCLPPIREGELCGRIQMA